MWVCIVHQSTLYIAKYGNITEESKETVGGESGICDH